MKQFSKIKREQIVTLIAIMNSVIIAFMSYLTIFMFNNQIGATEYFARILILICLFGSILTKIRRRNIWTITLSIVFDFILVLFLYNITDYSSIYEFLKSLFKLQTHIIVFLYLYLIFYYVYILKNYKK